jgi:zinc/manganese transport system permease protein
MNITEAVAGAGLSLDPVSDVNRLTAYPFMVNALEAGAIVAVMAAAVGWFMVLRRQAFAGHTLSLMAFPGGTAALLLGVSAAAGYFAFSAAAAIVIALGGRSRAARGEESALIGTVQAFGVACGFLFLSLYGGVLANYEGLLFGSFLGITRGQVAILAIVAAATLAVLAVIGRPLLFASLDEAVARAHGVPTRLLAVAFLLLLGLAVAETAQVTGVLLVFALLVAPPATAQLITARVGLSLLLSVALGVLVAWLGLALAYFYEYPVGFFVTTVAFVLYVLVRTARALALRPMRWRAPASAAGAGA